jgi:hypothetical protein
VADVYRQLLDVATHLLTTPIFGGQCEKSHHVDAREVGAVDRFSSMLVQQAITICC